MGSHNVAPQAVVTLKRVWNLRLHQKHQALVNEMNRLDGLEEVKSAAVLNIISYEVYPWGEGRPDLKQQQLRVDPVAAMAERAREADRHYDVPDPPLTHGNQKPQQLHCIPSRIAYGCAQSPWTGNS